MNTDCDILLKIENKKKKTMIMSSPLSDPVNFFTGKIAVILGMAFALTLYTPAQITTDGSIGSGSPMTLTGPNYAIDAKLGAQHSGNLFHSFGQFNINAGESAVFTGPDSIASVIARVTGGQPSLIDGILKSEIKNADFYFINPAGVIFGKQSQIEVDGAFNVSTADYLKFADHQIYPARLATPAILTTAPPSAYGFLRDTPAGIAINGTKIQADGVFSVIGGDIEVNGGLIEGKGGRVNLVSVQSQGEAIITEDAHGFPFQLEAFAQLGEVRLVGNSTVDDPPPPAQMPPPGQPPGPPFEAGIIIVDGNSGIINIQSDSLKILGGAGILVSNVESGRINIFSGTILIDGVGNQRDLGILSNTRAEAHGGDISIIADSLTLINGATVGANSFGTGNAGNVTVNVKTLLLDGQGGPLTKISSETRGENAGGNGGNIAITAEDISVVNHGIITANTFGSGEGGNIIIDTGSLKIKEAGITANTHGVGNGGFIDITASSIIAEGPGMPLAGIFAETVSPTNGGKSGDITINTGALRLLDGAIVSISSHGQGMGGIIEIKATTIHIDGNALPRTGIFSETTAPVDGGKGGTINIIVHDLTILDGLGLVAATTFGSGIGGEINIKANNIYLNGMGLIGKTNGIVAESLLGAANGNPGSAGNITITAHDSIQLYDNGSIKTSAIEAGGGSINIDVRNLLYLFNSEISTSVHGDGGDGNAGNITIDPINVVLNNSQIIANAILGMGGNINIFTKNLIKSSLSKVQASSKLGVDGNVDISSPDADISSGLIALNADFFNAEDWVIAPCAARRSENTSSLIVTGREGISLSPSNLWFDWRVHDGSSPDAKKDESEDESIKLNAPFPALDYIPPQPCLDCPK